jgi:hypothetical protein
MLGQLSAMKTSEPRTAFQSLMRAWSELAPYNFIHAMRLEEPADTERWQRAAEEALRTLETSAPVLIETPATDIDSHLEAELNRPFLPQDLPLRFFAIGPWFGAVIDHWLADDFSCRALLERMYSFYRSPDDSLDRPPLRWANMRPRKFATLPEWMSFLRQAMVFRQAVRVSLRDPLDFTVGTFRAQLPQGMLERVRRLAKEQSASVHDVFLAAAAQTFGSARARGTNERRDSVGLASAIDLRRFENNEGKSGFGLVISQYTIVERRPDEVSLRELIKRISERTRRWKAKPARDLFAPSLVLWRLSRSSRARATLFQRGAPLVTGLSNVNLTGSWIEQAPIAEYRRIGPTGPVVPILFMLTTLRGRIFVDVTYRQTAFTQIEAETAVQDFTGRLMTR